jgi:hypothetical protein
MRITEHRSRARGLADLLLPFALIEDGILLQQDGSLLAGWSFRGPDMHSATHSEMHALTARLNSILRLGSGWMLNAGPDPLARTRLWANAQVILVKMNAANLFEPRANVLQCGTATDECCTVQQKSPEIELGCGATIWLTSASCCQLLVTALEELFSFPIQHRGGCTSRRVHFRAQMIVGVDQIAGFHEFGYVFEFGCDQDGLERFRGAAKRVCQ